MELVNKVKILSGIINLVIILLVMLTPSNAYAASSSVSSVSASNTNGSYKVGDTIHVTVTFSKAETVTGTPRILLNTTM